VIAAAALPAVAAAAVVAPPVAGTDPITGKHVSLADYRGRVVVVNAWGSWCGGCIAEAAAIRAFERAHPNVAMVGIDVEDAKPSARAFYKAHGWTHPSIYDRDGKLATSLGVKGMPTTLFLDRRHRIVYRLAGAASRARLEAGLRAALRAGG
jgi:thiol-disulfide isomerase/thioredoxin